MKRAEEGQITLELAKDVKDLAFDKDAMINIASRLRALDTNNAELEKLSKDPENAKKYKDQIKILKSRIKVTEDNLNAQKAYYPAEWVREAENAYSKSKRGQ